MCAVALPLDNQRSRWYISWWSLFYNTLNRRNNSPEELFEVSRFEYTNRPFSPTSLAKNSQEIALCTIMCPFSLAFLRKVNNKLAFFMCQINLWPQSNPYKKAYSKHPFLTNFHNSWHFFMFITFLDITYRQYRWGISPWVGDSPSQLGISQARWYPTPRLTPLLT